jgi:transketolase
MSVLYFRIMDVDPKNPGCETRDRFMLSKGHAAPVYYAALAERGFFDKAELLRLRKIDSMLQGHPDRKRIPGVDMSSGSLGQGISAACGMAYYAKRNEKSWRTFCILGDGELQEGQVWEALMSAAHFRLGRLTAIIDRNGLQIDGPVSAVMAVEPLTDKLRAFGWEVAEADGHDVRALTRVLEQPRGADERPLALVCRTVKGRGVSFMENQAGWHGAPIGDADYAQAMRDLGCKEEVE